MDTKDNRDRHNWLLRYVDVKGSDAGLALIGQDLAIARYDSHDGNGYHPREPDHAAADTATPYYSCPASAPIAPAPPGASGCDPAHPGECIRPRLPTSTAARSPNAASRSCHPTHTASTETATASAARPSCRLGGRGGPSGGVALRLLGDDSPGCSPDAPGGASAGASWSATTGPRSAGPLVGAGGRVGARP